MAKLQALAVRTAIYLLIIAGVVFALSFLNRDTDPEPETESEMVERIVTEAADWAERKATLEYPVTALVTMPDGDTLEVIGRRPPRSAPPADGDEPLAGRLASLRAAAKNGDDGAALTLATELQHCGWYGLLRGAELENWARELERTGRYRAPLSESTENVESWYIPVLIEARRKAAEHCLGVTREDVTEYPVWLERAAEEGSLEAQIAFADVYSDTELRATNAAAIPAPEKGALYLDRARERGSVQAMEAFGTHYLMGRLPSPDWNPSRVHAYANLLAAEKVYEVHGGSCCRDLVARLERELSPEDRLTAVRLAKDLLRRRACCFL